jgi:hypothetical protein
MSESEKNSAASSTETLKNATKTVETVLALKDSNPKVFFGAIAGVVVGLIILLNLGGSNEVLPSKPAKELAVGQNYVLHGVNSFDANGKIRVVSVPGNMAAFDDTEEDPKDAGCSHIAQDTPVKILDFQDFSGKKNGFANIEILSGACKGRKGWVLSIDIQ